MSFVVSRTDKEVQDIIININRAMAWLPATKITGNNSLGTDMKIWVKQLDGYLDNGALPQRGGPVFNWLVGDLDTPLRDYEV